MASSDGEKKPRDKEEWEVAMKNIVVPLTMAELSSLRLKILEGESESDAIRRLISESFEMDAVEAALAKFLDVLERLIVMQRKLNWLGIESYEESRSTMKELADSVMSVSSLKKRLEKRWRSV